jgi:hypothetical protein
MRDTDHLIVVGYSFRDDHINVVIKDWLQNLNGRRLTIVDPFFPDAPGNLAEHPTFAEWLSYGIHEARPFTREEGQRDGIDWVLKEGCSVMREKAELALPRACAPDPHS